MSGIRPGSNSRPDALYPIAQMYVYRVLDFVVEYARAVSYDHFERPQYYRNVPEQVSRMLVSLRTRTGFDLDLPDAVQRVRLSNGLGNVYISLAGLRRAATVFAERGAGSGGAILRRALLEEAGTLRPALQGLNGEAVAVGNRQLKAIFAAAVDILSSAEVSRAFGLPPASPEAWWGNGDAGSRDAALLCEEIANRWGGRFPNEVSQQKFIMLQRVAHFGALTISDVLDGTFTSDEDEHLTALAQHAYSWTIALRYLLSNINLIQAWKSPEYRISLTIIERDLVPANPAGDIDLSSASLDAVARLAGAISTTTVSGEVCCSSGDLCSNYCNPTNIGFTCHDCRNLVIAR